MLLETGTVQGPRSGEIRCVGVRETSSSKHPAYVKRDEPKSFRLNAPLVDIQASVGLTTTVMSLRWS